MRFLIAGGGTGGHIFPGIALAQGFMRLSARHEILFVGTLSGIETKEVPKAGFQLETIEISGLKGQTLQAILGVLIQLPMAILKSVQILRKFEPNIVIGVGGYASGPVLLAAWLLRIPRVICEQNSIPGFTNRILGRYFVKTIFGGFQNCAKYFPPGRFALTGNPLRAAFAETPAVKAQGLLILGGSLGARPINNMLPKALALVEKIKITHQTGQAEVESVKAAYAHLGLQAEVVAFIEDMPKAYLEAQLVIGRAGAMTCSELTAMGVPSILIPFPQAIDDHQTKNAKELVAAGAAIVVKQAEMTPENLAGHIQHLLLDLKSLENMAHKARQIGRPNAADIIAQKVIELC